MHFFHHSEHTHTHPPFSNGDPISYSHLLRRTGVISIYTSYTGSFFFFVRDESRGWGGGGGVGGEGNKRKGEIVYFLCRIFASFFCRLLTRHRSRNESTMDYTETLCYCSIGLLVKKKTPSGTKAKILFFNSFNRDEVISCAGEAVKH